GFGGGGGGEEGAWGMEVPAPLAGSSGACRPDVIAPQHALLRDSGLLASPPAIDRAALLDAMRHDKKARAGELRWVLLREIGHAEYGFSVDPSVVEASLAEVLRV